MVSGAPRLVGVQNLLIPAQRDGSYGPADGTAYPGHGGDLAKYLFPRVIAEEHKTNPAAKGSEAWGWLPPPLHHEGAKVQTDWLHDFLMDPTRDPAGRRAADAELPHVERRSEQAGELLRGQERTPSSPTSTTSAAAAATWPSSKQSHPDAARRRDEDRHRRQLLREVPLGGRLTRPTGAVQDARARIWPRCIAGCGRITSATGSPIRVRILPYTGMPVNIPYDPNAPNFGGVSQALFPGTSIEQLDGVVDLLMNFDEYAKRQTSVRSLVKEPPAATHQSGRCFAADERSADTAIVETRRS